MPALIAFVLQYWKQFALALAFVGAFLAGVKYESNSCEVEKQQIINEYTQMIQDEVDRRYKISTEYEDKIANLKGETRTIIETIEVEVVKPIYKDCKVPESGVKLLNDSINRFNSLRKE
jgi:hypothetical protein